MLVLGWLTASACVNAVRTAAIRENEQVAEAMQDRMASVAQELVVVAGPAGALGAGALPRRAPRGPGASTG